MNGALRCVTVRGAYARCAKTPSSYQSSTTFVGSTPRYGPTAWSTNDSASGRVRGAMLNHISKVLPSFPRDSDLAALSLESPLPSVSITQALMTNDETEQAQVLDTLHLSAFGVFAAYAAASGNTAEDDLHDNLQMARGRRAIERFKGTLNETELAMMNGFLASQPVEEIARDLAPFERSSAVFRAFVSACVTPFFGGRRVPPPPSRPFRLVEGVTPPSRRWFRCTRGGSTPLATLVSAFGGGPYPRWGARFGIEVGGRPRRRRSFRRPGGGPPLVSPKISISIARRK